MPNTLLGHGYAKRSLLPEIEVVDMKIFLLESIPSFNRGEAAILYGMLESFKTLSNPEVTILSHFPDEDKEFYGEDVTVLPNWFKFRGEYLLPHKKPSFSQRLKSASFFYLRLITYSVCLRLLGRSFLRIVSDAHWLTFLTADLLIGGHDNLFSTSVPTYFAVMTLMAKYVLKKRIIIYGGSLDPCSCQSHARQLITRTCSNQVQLITLRDPNSFQSLCRIGVTNPNMHVTPDLAFLMPSCSEERVQEIHEAEGIERGDKPLIGIGFSKSVLHGAFNFKGDLTKLVEYNDHIKIMTKFIDYLIDTLGAQVVLISHSVGPVRFVDDRIIAGDCYHVITPKDRVKFITTEYTPQELKGLIGSFDAFIGSRTHSLIAAGSMKVPSIVIALSDMAKVKGILGQMLGLDRWIIDVRALTYDELVATFSQLWNERQSVRKELEERMCFIKQKSLENIEFLQEIMK